MSGTSSTAQDPPLSVPAVLHRDEAVERHREREHRPQSDRKSGGRQLFACKKDRSSHDDQNLPMHALDTPWKMPCRDRARSSSDDERRGHPPRSPKREMRDSTFVRTDRLQKSRRSLQARPPTTNGSQRAWDRKPYSALRPLRPLGRWSIAFRRIGLSHAMGAAADATLIDTWTMVVEIRGIRPNLHGLFDSRERHCCYDVPLRKLNGL